MTLRFPLPLSCQTALLDDLFATFINTPAPGSDHSKPSHPRQDMSPWMQSLIHHVDAEDESPGRANQSLAQPQMLQAGSATSSDVGADVSDCHNGRPLAVGEGLARAIPSPSRDDVIQVAASGGCQCQTTGSESAELNHKRKNLEQCEGTAGLSPASITHTGNTTFTGTSVVPPPAPAPALAPPVPSNPLAPAPSRGRCCQWSRKHKHIATGTVTSAQPTAAGRTSSATLMPTPSVNLFKFGFGDGDAALPTGQVTQDQTVALLAAATPCPNKGGTGTVVIVSPIATPPFRTPGPGPGPPSVKGCRPRVPSRSQHLLSSLLPSSHRLHSDVNSVKQPTAVADGPYSTSVSVAVPLTYTGQYLAAGSPPVPVSTPIHLIPRSPLSACSPSAGLGASSSTSDSQPQEEHSQGDFLESVVREIEQKTTGGIPFPWITSQQNGMKMKKQRHAQSWQASSPLTVTRSLSTSPELGLPARSVAVVASASPVPLSPTGLHPLSVDRDNQYLTMSATTNELSPVASVPAPILSLVTPAPSVSVPSPNSPRLVVRCRRHKQKRKALARTLSPLSAMPLQSTSPLSPVGSISLPPPPYADTSSAFQANLLLYPAERATSTMDAASSSPMFRQTSATISLAQAPPPPPPPLLPMQPQINILLPVLHQQLQQLQQQTHALQEQLQHKIAVLSQFQPQYAVALSPRLPPPPPPAADSGSAFHRPEDLLNTMLQRLVPGETNTA